MGLSNWAWKPRPDYRRLLKTIRRCGDPQRVPFLELFADREVISAVLDEPMVPRGAQTTDRQALEAMVEQEIRFWHSLGYDALWLGPIIDLPGRCRLEVEDTAGLPRDKRRWMEEKSGVIACWKDFDCYPWPKARDADTYPIEYAARRMPEGMGILAEVYGPLETAMELMGYQTLSLALYDQPELVAAVFKGIAEFCVPLARTLVQMDRVVGLWMGDDMGFKTSTLISPDHLRKFVLPVQERVAAIAHEYGKPFLLHSCGSLSPVMDDLIDRVGIDAKHSFEDVIEPVEAYLARYGNRVAVIGGIDVDLLARGSEEQVRVRTREVLHACAPSGGYILGSGNSIANYIPVRNFLAMVDEGWRYREAA